MKPVLLFALLAASVLGAAEVPAPAVNDARIYFDSTPDFSAPGVAPDGSKVAFIARTQDHGCLYDLDLATGKMQGLFNPGEGDVAKFWWLGNDRILFVGRGRSGSLFYTLNLADGKTQRLYSMSKEFDNPSLSDRESGLPNDVVVPPGGGDSVVRLLGHEVVKVDTRSDKRTTLETLSDVMSPSVLTRTGEVRAAIHWHNNIWTVYWRTSANQPWQHAESTGLFPPFRPIGMAADGQHLVVIAFDQGNTAALMQFDPATAQRTLIAQRPDRDVTGALFDPNAQTLLAAIYAGNGHDEIEFLDAVAKSLNEQIAKALPGENHRVLSMSADGGVCVIQVSGTRTLPSYYLFDRKRKRLSLLGQARPDIKPELSGTMREFRYRTKDGLEESGWILLPPGVSQAHVPVIVFSYNFFSTDPWYNGVAQYFAQHGYGVAAFATRGYDGFGRVIEDPDDPDVGEKGVHDLEDGVAALGADGTVDPARVAIFGYDYDGAVALRAAADGTVFHAVIALHPQSDFSANNLPWVGTQTLGGYSKIEQAGGVEAAYARARKFDPVTSIPHVSAPLLLMYFGKFGHEYPYFSQSAGTVRGAAESSHKTYTWQIVEPARDGLRDAQSTMEFNTHLFAPILAFLDSTFKKPAAP